MIADTAFVIDLMNKDYEALEKIKSSSKIGESILITSITIFELFSGLIRSGRPEEEKRKAMDTLLGQLILDLDEPSAKTGGEVHGKLIKNGRTVGSHDCMIAGIALRKKDKVLTRNVKDFSRISGLEIESY